MSLRDLMDMCEDNSRLGELENEDMTTEEIDAWRDRLVDEYKYIKLNLNII